MILMKKPLIIISILLISLLFLAACKTKSKTPSTGFIGGENGVESQLTIRSTAGGNKVYDAGTDRFNIDILLENKGEDSVEAGEVLVTLEGVNLKAFDINNPTQSNTIPLFELRREGGSVTDPAQTIIEYNALYKTDEDSDVNANLIANYCYKYQTKVSVPNFCIKKKVTGPSAGIVCSVDEIKTAGNSGGPIEVVTFSERPAGENKISIFLEVENVGGGTVYKQDYLSQGKCIDSEADKNKVYVKVDLPDYEVQSSSMIKCSSMNANEGIVSVTQNKVQLSCTIDTSSVTQETAFETRLRATFDYVYKNSVSTVLTIKSS